MSDAIPMAALKEVPFLKPNISPGHPILSLSFFVQDEWHCWLPHGDKLVKMKMWPVESTYFGDKPERDSDQDFALLNLMAQRTFGDEMHRCYSALFNDFQGLSASLAKMRMFFENRDNQSYGITRLVQSEIENLAVLCRSVFDLLQEIVGFHVARMTVVNGPTPQKLPRSFREVVYKSERDQSASEISARYSLPMPIADWYVRHRDFFMELRSIRDSIVHRGASIRMVFSTERGFAVSRTDDPFRGMYNWPEGCELPNALVPMRPALATIVAKTIAATNDFAETLESSVQMQSDLAPKLRLYARGTNDHEFASLNDVIGSSLWDDT